jgi:hypothetical protein
MSVNHRHLISVTYDVLQQNASRVMSREGYSNPNCIPSDKFMPCREGEDDIGTAGLLGRLVDAVNTAKDIAYII